MGGRMGAKSRNFVINVINHRETNFIITCLITILAIYIFFTAIFDRNLFNPLNISKQNGPANYSEFNTTVLMREPKVGDKNSTATGKEPMDGFEEDPSEHYISAFFSFFLLWILALVLGQAMKYVYLPPLFGHMLIGIAFTNFQFLKGVLLVLPAWDNILRRIAFILILIRCAFGIDYDALQRSFLICGSIGLISTTFEALLITLTSHFFYALPIGPAILFGYILASTSPAVTVPTMIRLQKEDRGTEKGIPTIALASAAIDNIYCITAFSAIAAVVFARAEKLTYIIVKVPFELLLAAIIGTVAGIIVRSFPRNDAKFKHFQRGTLAIFVPFAFYFGTRAAKADVAGSIAAIMVSIVIAMRWKIDNRRRTRAEEKSFRILWNVFFQPFLFVLIGLLLDISIFSWMLLTQALVILAIGVFGRIFIVLVTILCTKFNCKERLFLCLAFSPKATVQAALAPILYQLCKTDYPEDSGCRDLILQTCILSIIITAPVGQLILFILGKTMLQKRVTSIMGGSGGHSSTHSTINAYKADMTQKISGPYFVPTSGQLAIGPAQNGGGSTPPGFNRHRLEMRDVSDQTTVAVIHTPSTSDSDEGRGGGHKTYKNFRDGSIRQNAMQRLKEVK